eukprot:TRINITY_DN1009_c0_g1_i1.p2 TRINITY_DN1009_c0_g1~~TRINITY_DN1009_c0_g1_i1.p2  ORF type:complete len:211 (-),score=49.85 TRINITY_DN1009_c0_g1_i1:210-842(-)
MRYDSVTQGFGLIVLSTGLTVAAFFFFNSVENTIDVSPCQAVSTEFIAKGSNSGIGRGPDPPSDSFVILAEFELNDDPQLTPISIRNCGCSDADECARKYNVAPFRPFSCFYDPDTQQLTLDDSASKNSTLALVAVVYLCLCVPCCFIAGWLTLVSGLFDLRLTMNDRFRCDNTGAALMEARLDAESSFGSAEAWKFARGPGADLDHKAL